MRLPDDLPVPGNDRLRLVLDVDLGLLALADRLRDHWAAHATAVDLSTAQVRVLLMLRPGEAVPMRSLAARLDYDASNLTTLVDRLARKGTVARQPDPADRRIKALVLTPDGEQLRATFWQNLTDDPGPLAPLKLPDLQVFAALLAEVDH